MNLSVPLPRQEPSHQDVPIQVVLAYDGNAAFQAARESYHTVVRRLAGQFEFRECWLPFSALAGAASLECSMNVTTDTDVVFCCPNNAYFLPEAVQNWLRLWLARRRQIGRALAVLLPVMVGKASHPTLVERDLRATAQVNGLAFFAREYTVDDLHVSPPLAVNTPVIIGEDFDVVSVAQDQTEFRHWGINE